MSTTYTVTSTKSSDVITGTLAEAIAAAARIEASLQPMGGVDVRDQSGDLRAVHHGDRIERYDDDETYGCGGCGDVCAAGDMTPHNGSWYCDGCESAPADEVES